MGIGGDGLVNFTGGKPAIQSRSYCKINEGIFGLDRSREPNCICIVISFRHIVKWTLDGDRYSVTYFRGSFFDQIPLSTISAVPPLALCCPSTVCYEKT